MKNWTIGALVLGLLATYTDAGAQQRSSSHQCTAAEQRASDAYFNPDGTTRATAKGPMIKWCDRAEVANRYDQWCDKPGFTTVADHVQRYLARFLGFFEASAGIYDAYTTTFKPPLDALKDYLELQKAVKTPTGGWAALTPRTRPVHPAEGANYAYFRKGENVIRGTNAIIIPQVGETLYYEDRLTLLNFSLTMQPGDSGSWLQQRLNVAFRGSIPGEHSADFIKSNFPAFVGAHREPYLRAELIGIEISSKLASTGVGCSTRIVYTGHSLGGGYAIAAGTMSGVRCSKRGGIDSIVVFNPARPVGDNLDRLLVKHPMSSVGKIVFFANAGDVVKRAHLHPADLIYKEGTAAMILGDRLPSLERTYRLVKLEGMDAAMMRPSLAAIIDHGIEDLRLELNQLAVLLPPWPQPISKPGIDALCKAYNP